MRIKQHNISVPLCLSSGYTQLTETKDIFGNVTDQQVIADDTTYNSSATYDLAGNQLTSTDFNGNTTSYEYDHQGRITKTTNALGASATATYDITNTGGRFYCNTRTQKHRNTGGHTKPSPCVLKAQNDECGRGVLFILQIQNLW